MYKIFLYLSFCVFLLSCDQKRELSQRLNHFYNALSEVELQNTTEKKGYLIEAFEKGDLERIEREINFFCFEKREINISEEDPCPKFQAVKEDESIDFFSTKNTISYFHKYFFQKINKL